MKVGPGGPWKYSDFLSGSKGVLKDPKCIVLDGPHDATKLTLQPPEFTPRQAAHLQCHAVTDLPGQNPETRDARHQGPSKQP